VDITVSGKKCEVTDQFRDHVEDKLGRLERIDERVERVAVQVCHENNPSRSSVAERVELTFFTKKGTVVRAEASAVDRFAALDAALDRLTAQVRRYRDRTKVHRGRHAPVSVAQATASLLDLPDPDAEWSDEEPPPAKRDVAGVAVEGDGPLVVREKTFDTKPMCLAEALEQMELVGHDFFLFVDSTTMLPSVAYRRRGYDFGLIRLADMLVTPGAHATGVPTPAKNHHKKALDHIAS
jgi:ribosomal subunit interface protein